MLHRFDARPAPLTPVFWNDLEEELRAATVQGVIVDPIEPNPAYELELDDTLTSQAPLIARRESLPVAALAAAAAIVVLLAGFSLLGFGHEEPVTAATPGVETTTTLAAPVTAEQMVVNSFQRWVDGRSEAERLTSRYRDAGYDVVVQRLNVADASLNGQVIEVRHAIATTHTTVAQPRGQVVLVIGRAVSAGPNVSS